MGGVVKIDPNKDKRTVKAMELYSDCSNANNFGCSKQNTSNEGVSSEIDDAEKELEKLLHPGSYLKKF